MANALRHATDCRFISDGLTLQCARCHDHKYEPVSQKDYYRMLAILQGAYGRKAPYSQVTSGQLSKGHASKRPRLRK